jgi:membrane-associated phospholipid phosphatase
MFSFYLIFIFAVLLVVKPTRKIALALVPWLIFACSYDWMRLLPNYEVNSIDVKGLYDTEKSLFGISSGGVTMIPGEFFAAHNCGFADFMAGLFYLCWVPVPIGFGLWLYFKGYRKHYLHFAIAFLFVNILGFCGYYIHPAAPPWYAMNYGFQPILNTPGNVAGLGRFDLMTGIPVFHGLYGKNANVFAAIPSLHAAYMLITTIYAVISRRSKITIAIFAFITVGIWCTAVYTGHHYIIDVLLGIGVAIVGVFLLEKVIFRLSIVQKWMNKYENNI